MYHAKYFTSSRNLSRIKVLPPLVFENLNSLETLNLQNNRLTHLSEEVTDYITDTLRHIDMTGKKHATFLLIDIYIISPLIEYTIITISFISSFRLNYHIKSPNIETNKIYVKSHRYPFSLS